MWSLQCWKLTLDSHPLVWNCVLLLTAAFSWHCWVQSSLTCSENSKASFAFQLTYCIRDLQLLHHSHYSCPINHLKPNGGYNYHVYYVKILHPLIECICMLHMVLTIKSNCFLKKPPWPESASELYRPDDRRFSVKSVSTFADRGVSRSQRGGSPTAVISDF
jgi:hypothetical protein